MAGIALITVAGVGATLSAAYALYRHLKDSSTAVSCKCQSESLNGLVVSSLLATEAVTDEEPLQGFGFQELGGHSSVVLRFRDATLSAQLIATPSYGATIVFKFGDDKKNGPTSSPATSKSFGEIKKWAGARLSTEYNVVTNNCRTFAQDLLKYLQS